MIKTNQVGQKFSVIIGLGNPGLSYIKTRHNIGFRVVDALCQKYRGNWQKKDNYDTAEIEINHKQVLLIKPQTTMNLSGRVIPILFKKGYQLSDVLVIYDELEKKFGALQLKQGGSHRGHNGVRSIMEHGEDFWRLRIGIDRPARKEDVGDYVLSKFTADEEEKMDELIEKIVKLIDSNI